MSTMRTAGVLGNIQTQDVVGKSRFYIFFFIPQAANCDDVEAWDPVERADQAFQGGQSMGMMLYCRAFSQNTPSTSHNQVGSSNQR